MELTFLGTSAGTPTRTRNASALALRLGSSWDLFDCGEATQHRVLQTPLTLGKLERIFISHLHGDHCLGLFGLLGTRSMEGTSRPLTIVGPPGLRAMIEAVLGATSTHLRFPLDVHEVDPAGGRIVTDDDIEIDAVPLTHRVTSFAWSMREPDRPGSFDPDAARAAGVPAGPLFGRLQRGESVETPDGRTVRPDQVTGPTRPGRHIVIAGDNAEPDSLFATTDGADLAVHEATFTESILATLPDDRGHSTAARVARAAEATGVGNLVLTHFSPRFADGGTGPTIDEVHDEARAHFGGNLHLARDLDRIDLTHDGSEIHPHRAAAPLPVVAAPTP